MASTRPPRADAVRNRQQLLDTTQAMLAEHGQSVTMDQIARASGLGSGTLYRHFPDRDALLSAVVANQIERTIQELEGARAISDPDRELRTVLGAFARRVASDRALAEVIAAQVEDRHLNRSPLLVDQIDRAYDLLSGLVQRAQTAGVLRTDIAVTDLPPLVRAIGRIRVPNADPDLWQRYLDLTLDGLKPQPGSRLSHQPPPRPQTRDR